jgi:hypothetical protein
VNFTFSQWQTSLLVAHLSIGNPNRKAVSNGYQAVSISHPTTYVQVLKYIDEYSVLVPPHPKSSFAVANMDDLRPEDFCFPHSDVQIIVRYNGSEIEGCVSTEAMASASPAWKNFVYPPRQISSFSSQVGSMVDSFSLLNVDSTSQKRACGKTKSRTPSTATIDFTEDDAETLLVLLQIAHSRFEKIPVKIDRKLLFNIALVCEEYLCTSLVKAWIAEWTIGTEMIIKQFTDNLEKDECLLIYWAFGTNAHSNGLHGNWCCSLEYKKACVLWRIVGHCWKPFLLA